MKLNLRGLGLKPMGRDVALASGGFVCGGVGIEADLAERRNGTQEEHGRNCELTSRILLEFRESGDAQRERCAPEDRADHGVDPKPVPVSPRLAGAQKQTADAGHDERDPDVLRVTPDHRTNRRQDNTDESSSDGTERDFVHFDVLHKAFTALPVGAFRSYVF